MRRKTTVALSVALLALLAAAATMLRGPTQFTFVRRLQNVAYVTSSSANEAIFTAKEDYDSVLTQARTELSAAGYTEMPARGPDPKSAGFHNGDQSVYVMRGRPADTLVDPRIDALPGGFFPDREHVTVMITRHGNDKLGVWLFDLKRKLGI